MNKDNQKIEEIKNFIRKAFIYIPAEGCDTSKSIIHMVSIKQDERDKGIYYISVDDWNGIDQVEIFISKEDYMANRHENAIFHLTIKENDNRMTVDLTNQPDGLYCFTLVLQNERFYPIKCIKKGV